MAQLNVTDAELEAAVSAYQEAADTLADIADRIERMKSDELTTISEMQFALNAGVRDGSVLIGRLFIQSTRQRQKAEIAALRSA
jgi:hypothetical protein